MRFDRRAADYERHATPQARVVAHLLACVPDAPPGTAALELGAGTGLLTRGLLAKGYRVVATDLSAAMVAAGRRAVPGAEWRVLDAFGPADGRHAFLFSANLLQWAEDAPLVFRRLRDRLTPGGRMAHAILVPPTLKELNRLIGDAAPVRWRPAEDWVRDAETAGFRVTRADTVVFQETYADARALLADLHGSGAVSGTPAHGAGSLRSLLRRYDAENARPDGDVSATWAALILEAENPALRNEP